AAALVTDVSVADRKRGEQQESAAAEQEEREKLKELLLAKVRQVLKERQEAKLVEERQAAKESAEREEARLAEIRSSFRLPPARKHATISTGRPSLLESTSPKERVSLPRRCCDSTSYITYPLQLVEGKLLLFDPGEFKLWPLMSQLQGWSLELGAAPVWGGGNEREAEAFSVACGFSAAFGPIVLRVVATAVYGKVFASGVSVLPTDHVVYAFGRYWETEMAPCADVTERFFRLARAGSGTAAGDGDR
ncbi:unnamed protein product, partial [Hapterophycus canaliculatus]